MAIKLGTKPKAAPQETAQATEEDMPWQEGEDAQEEAQEEAPAPTQTKAKPQAQTQAKPAGGLSFIKKGKAAQETMAKEEHKAEQKSKGSVHRFWLPKDKDGCITFLDGDLKDGMLDIPFYYEHQVNMNGSWNNHFICTQDEEPCPVCEGGHSPSYVGVFTIIDHSEYVSKKDGKTYKDQVRLLVAKRDSIKTLQKLAEKRGGLRGCKFDVSRTGDKSPSIGNVFDFTEKLTGQQLSKLYTAKGADGKVYDKSKPLNYEELLVGMYMPAKELRKLGFGSMSTPVGSESMPSEDEMADNL